MTPEDPPRAVLPLDHAPADMSYPGLSPQLLARVTRLWSAAGLDLDPHWRTAVPTTLGAAIHSNALTKRFAPSGCEAALVNGDSLHFATFRIHEFCACSQLVRTALADALNTAGAHAHAPGPDRLAALAGPLNAIHVRQIPSLGRPGTDSPAPEARRP
ncbi:MAG: hypothetical protein CML66_26450 [Rhodobacteraceae bacterium]|nr:hypothetical protein [Paracoccaceae bacterium]MAY44191.1 hypothetical protein [Paracoccaceae bacterium]